MRWTYVVGVFLLILAFETGEEPRGDAASRLLITKQLLADGSVHLPRSHPEWWLIQTPEGWTSFYGIGQTLLFVPFELAGGLLSLAAPGGGLAAVLQQFPLKYLYVPLIGLGFFLALRALLEALGLTAWEAACASLLVTLSSVTAHYVLQSFQEEAVVGLLACLSLRSALLFGRSLHRRYAVEAGVLFGCMLLFRVNAIFVFIPVAMLFAQGLRAQRVQPAALGSLLAAFAAGAAGPAAIHAVFAYLRFGDPLSTGYDQLSLEDAPLPLWGPFEPAAVASLLFGLGKGLFIYSPLLAAAVWGVWIDRSERRLYGIGALAALAGSVILSAFFYTPDGCWSWGARYQVHVVPLFTYPAWVGIRDLLQKPLGRPLVGVATALGVLFQFCALIAPERMEYSQLPINWDWKGMEAGCPVIQDRQFPMRLENIATALLTVGAGAKLMDVSDPVIVREFGYFWPMRIGRHYHGWTRVVIAGVWLTVLAAALICLYHSLWLNRAGQDAAVPDKHRSSYRRR